MRPRKTRRVNVDFLKITPEKINLLIKYFIKEALNL